MVVVPGLIAVSSPVFLSMLATDFLDDFHVRPVYLALSVDACMVSTFPLLSLLLDGFTMETDFGYRGYTVILVLARANFFL